MSDTNQTFLETVNEEDEEEEEADVVVDKETSPSAEKRCRADRSPDSAKDGVPTPGKTKIVTPGASPPNEEPRMADSMDSGVESDYGKLSKSIEDPISVDPPSTVEVPRSSRPGNVGRTMDLHIRGIDRMIRLQDGRIISQRELIVIYTQWANHYLEKAGEETRISDLQTDLADGLLLAAIVQSIGGEKVKAINQIPNSAEEKISNIQKSLDLLSRLGLELENVTAKDIYAGRLQPILLLFYSLSRLKQQIRRPSLDNNKRSVVPSSSCQQRRRPSLALDLRSTSVAPGNHLYFQNCHLVSNNNDDVTNIREPVEYWHHVTNRLGCNANSSSAIHPQYHHHHHQFEQQQQQQQSSQHHLTGSAFKAVGRRAALKSPGAATAAAAAAGGGTQNSSKLHIYSNQGVSHSSIPRPLGRNSRSPVDGCQDISGGTPVSAGIDHGGRNSEEEKVETRSAFDKAGRGSTACMLGKLKLFNSKDQSSSSSAFSKSPVGSSSHTPSAIHPHGSEQFSDHQEERGAVLQHHPSRSSSSSVDGNPHAVAAIGLSDQRVAAKGRGKDVHGLSGSNIPGPVVSSGFPTMEERDRKRPGSSTAPAGRVATTPSSTSQPRPSALPSSRTSSTGSISSLSGIGTLGGTPVASSSSSSSAAKSSSKSAAAKVHSAAGTRNSAPRQGGTATALAPPPSSSLVPATGVMQQGKSGGTASSGRTRPAKTSSAVGTNQPVGRSPSSVGLSLQSIDRSPSSHGISQAGGAAAAAASTGKMTALKQTDGKARSCENDDLNRCRSAGSSGSRTGLNSILAGPPSGSGGMIRSSSRSALQPPQAGRRDGVMAAEQKRSPAAASSSLMQEPEFYGDPRRQMSSPDPKISKSSQKSDIRQGTDVSSNLRSPLTVPPQTVGSGKAKDVGTPDSGLSPSLSSFKPSPSPSTHLPSSASNGAARDSGPQLKPRKIDSDTQTTATIMHARRQTGAGQQQQQQLPSAAQYPGYYRQLSPQGGGVGLQSAIPKGRGERRPGTTDARDQSNSSLNSDSTTASGLGDESSKSGSGASNSNNSASSTDSVIYRPASCDEGGSAEGGPAPASKTDASPRRGETTKPNQESSSKGGRPATQFTDHISSLRNKRNNEETRRLQQEMSSGGGGSKEPPRATAAARNEDCGSPPTEVEPSSSGKSSTVGGRGGGGGGGDRGGDDGSGAGEEMTPFDVGIKPMQPITRSSPYAYLRSLPVSLDRPTAGAHHHHHPASPSSSVAGAASGRLGGGGGVHHRPLLDPSNMYLSPGRNVGGLMMGSGRYLPRISADAPSDSEGFDVTAGYMSDGDILRSSYLDDVNSGYMSEGGLTQYVKRIQQRFREGMLAVKECMEKSNLGDDDSADDGSSISSSEISDAINEVSTDENLTGSSLSGASSERNSYGSIRHGILGTTTITAATTTSTATGGGVSPYTFRSLPLSHRAYLQQMRNGGGGGGSIGCHQQRVFSCGGATRCGVQQQQQPPDSCLGENWQKYTIREDGRSGDAGSFSRGTINRATLPVAARERAGAGDHHQHHHHRGFGYPLGLPGGIYVKKSHQAVITDLKGRSLRAGGGGGGNAGSGTAVAVEEEEEEDGGNDNHRASSQSQQQQQQLLHPQRQKRDSETNTDLSAMAMMQKARAAAAGAVPRDHSGSVSDCETASRAAAAAASRSARHHGLVLGRGSLIQADRGQQQHYPHGTSSLERHTAEMAAAMRRNDAAAAADYSSGSLGRRYADDQGRPPGADSGYRDSSGSRGSAAAQGLMFARNGPNPRNGNYVNIDSLWATDHGPRPLSDGLESPAAANGLGGGGGGRLAMKPGRVLRTALSETDSVEDLSYSPFGFRGHGSQTDNCGLGSRSLKHNEDMNRGYYSDYATSMSPGNTLHRAESLHMTSASGAHGSSLSLMSSSSSVYSTAEEKQGQEIRKLRRELDAAQEKVNTLTTQLSTNAHVVAAFEQSLASMTQRLQQLNSTSQQKDSELNDLKETIEALRLQSRSHVANSSGGGGGAGAGGGATGGGSGTSLTRQSIDQMKDSTCSGLEPPTINRHMSADSVTSLNSLSSATSQQSSATDLDKKKKKKNWLKNSFTKAFSRKKGKQGSTSDFDADSVSLKSDTSISNSLMLGAVHPMSTPTTPTRAIQLSTLMMKSDCVSGVSGISSRDEAVSQLKQELHEKDLKLTDIQLEALTSAHQLEQLYEIMSRMKSEMSSLKADNERLQRIISQRGLDPSLVASGRFLNALENELSPESNRHSLAELPASEANSSSGELTAKKEGKRVLVSVLLGSGSNIGSLESRPVEILIGALLVSKVTKWESFESTLRRAFKEYMTRIEPSNSMGLNTDSILMYRAGDIIRTKSSKYPDASPYDCLKDHAETISVTLKGTQENSVDSLAFETLIPKAIMQRYVSLLLEHRRIILCGPSGTGKTYLAQKLAEYVVSVSGKDLLAGLVATFNVDHKSSKELRQYLANIAEQCEHNAADLPSIIILDNLHHVGSLSEVFTGFLSVKHQQCPYIIGTMNQTTCSTTNLQLHHNFRWVLCANHMEPVKGFLGRYLRHKLVDEEVKSGVRNQEMNKIADWLPKVWQHLNKFLELHSSSDVTIGPRLFLACPMDVTNAQVWFTDLWNYSIVPYLLEAVREGIQTYGHRAPWEDPAEWVIETYPWGKVDMPALLHLRTEDVGYDPQGGTLLPGKSQMASSDTENKDPLMNMLLRLQEAASYSSPPPPPPPSSESHSTGGLDGHEPRVSGSTSKSPLLGDSKT